MRRVLLGLAIVLAFPTAAHASREDRTPCHCPNQRQDERPRCYRYSDQPQDDDNMYYDSDDDYGDEPAMTPTTRESTTTTTVKKKAEEATTTSTTANPPLVIHQDPKPQIDTDVLGKRIVAIDAGTATHPAPLTELPKTGGAGGLAMAGFCLALGGAGIAVSPRRRR